MALSARPPLALPVEEGAIPDELRGRPQWVAWRWELRQDRWTKPPIDPHTGEYAAVDRPDTWASFGEARAAQSVHKLPGVGFVLTPGDPYAVLDYDHCRDAETGAIHLEAQHAIAQLDSYAEVTPSGAGVRVIVRGTLPPGRRRRGDVELYDQARYITVTGNHLDGTPAAIAERTDALARLHARVFALPATSASNGHAAPAATAGLLDDDAALLERARRAANGWKLDRLLRGDWQGSYPSQSEADAALCQMLAFWTGKDVARIDRLFRQSGLMRDKWDERHGEQTYGVLTITHAVERCAETYTPTSVGSEPAATAPAHPTPGLRTDEPRSRAERAARAADVLATAPPLPDEAMLTDRMQQLAMVSRSIWLNRYMKAAGAFAPRSPQSLLEASGLFTLATVLARRCFLMSGGLEQYPQVFLLFVGDSTLTGKTTLLRVLRKTFRDAGLLHLLLPDRFNEASLLQELSLYVPPKVVEGSTAQQQIWLERHRHAAQRGIIRDEMHGLLDDCNRDYNTGLLPLLLALDGAPDELPPDLTISRGWVTVEDVCVNLMGCTTPMGLEQHAAKPYHWANGLFGRFALVAPGEPPHWAFWPREEVTLPHRVVQDLRTIYEAFPMPIVSFEYGPGGENGGERIVGATQARASALKAHVTEDAWEAWQRYDRALFGLAVQQLGTSGRLRPTYGRLPTLAVRVALTFAASEWALVANPAQEPVPTLELRHWAAAQEIAERWRTGAHAILAAALRGASEDERLDDASRLIRALQLAGGFMRRGEALRRLGWDKERLDGALEAAGEHVQEHRVRREEGGRPAEWLALPGVEFARFSRFSSQGPDEPIAPHMPPQTKPTKPSKPPEYGEHGEEAEP